MRRRFDLEVMRRECVEDEAVGVAATRLLSQKEILAMVKEKREERVREAAEAEGEA